MLISSGSFRISNSGVPGSGFKAVDIPNPSYSLSSIPNSINEGVLGTFTVSTTNVANGTTLYWTIVNGTTIDSDFSAVSGSFTINNGTGTFDITPAADLTTEGPQTFAVQVRIDSITGTVVATSANVTINDTSVLANGAQTYIIPGIYYWTVPENVTSISVVAIGGGASGKSGSVGNDSGSKDGAAGVGGGGGGLGYVNEIPVIPGQTHVVIVGAGGIGSNIEGGGSAGESSYFKSNAGANIIIAYGGGFNANATEATGGLNGGIGGTYFVSNAYGTYGGGNGGDGGFAENNFAGTGGGGAGGYSGDGGDGGYVSASYAGTSGSGGAAGGGAGFNGGSSFGGSGGGGGGTGILGEGPSGSGGAHPGSNSPVGGGAGGSSGTAGIGGVYSSSGVSRGGTGGSYGGGGGGASYFDNIFFGGNYGRSGDGGSGAVRIIWPGTTRQFPTANVGA